MASKFILYPITHISTILYREEAFKAKRAFIGEGAIGSSAQATRS